MIYKIKDKVVSSGKPFRHRDGTWYLNRGGTWIKLIRVGRQFLNKRGEVVYDTAKDRGQ